MTNKQLSSEVTRLSMRVNTLVDEIHVLKAELKKFKTDVGEDVKYLTQQTNK